MKRRALAGAGATTFGAATAITALVFTTGIGHAQTGESSAFGFEASGLIDFGPEPQVTSTDGSTVSDEALEIDEDFLFVQFLGVEAGNNEARATATDVQIFPGIGDGDDAPGLPDDDDDNGGEDSVPDPTEGGSPLDAVTEDMAEGSPLEQGEAATLIEDLAAQFEELDVEQILTDLQQTGDPLVSLKTVEATCEGDSGATTLIELEVAGEEVINIVPDAHEELLPLAPILNVTANEQFTDENGDFTVRGLVIDILGEPGDPSTESDAAQQFVISEAKCGGPAQVDDEDEKDPPKKDDKPEAPKPEPVEEDLPVTG